MVKGKHGKKEQGPRSTWKLAAGVLCLALFCGMGGLYYLNSTGQINIAPTSSSSAATEASDSPSSMNSSSNSSGLASTSLEPSGTSSQAINTTSSTIDIARQTEEAKKRAEAEAAQEKERAEAEAAAKKEAQEAARDFSDEVTSTSIIEKVPEVTAASIFSLNEKRQDPAVSEEQLASVQAAADDISAAGYTYTAIFLDINSGQGIAINPDEAVYTASSFKAPFVDFLLENNLASEWETYNMEASVLHSDNDTFEALSGTFEFTGKDTLTVSYDECTLGFVLAASMAACWADIYHYIRSDDTQAAWFKDLLANTNISFIRNALEGEDVQVWNKGGWLADPEYNAVADCGIIESNGRSYLMAILTSQPSWGETQERVQNLARALWDCKDALA